MTGFGFAPPATIAELGRPGPAARDAATARRSRCSTTAPSTWPATPPTSRRCATRSRTPAGGALPVYCASLRTAEPELLDAAGTGRRDGGHRAGRRRRHSPPPSSAGGDDEAWDVGAPGRAGHPDPAGPVPDQRRARSGQDNDDGLSPARRRHPGGGARVRRPDHHGAVLVQGDRRRRADRLRRRPRALRPGGRARGAARPAARTSRPPDKRVALVLSAYPTKHARIGNAVGLDTPASAVALLRAMRDAGYDIGDVPGVDAAGRRRADPRADRARRPGPGLADRGAAGGQPDPVARQGLSRRGSPRCPPS